MFVVGKNTILIFSLLNGMEKKKLLSSCRKGYSVHFVIRKLCLQQPLLLRGVERLHSHMLCPARMEQKGRDFEFKYWREWIFFNSN